MEVTFRYMILAISFAGLDGFLKFRMQCILENCKWSVWKGEGEEKEKQRQWKQSILYPASQNMPIYPTFLNHDNILKICFIMLESTH